MNLRITFVLLAVFVPHCAAQQGSFREMSLKDLRDRIAGGWAGQMIGVSYGAPTEFRSRGVIIEGALKPWTPDRVSNSLGQDDLYVDMTFAKVLDDKGLDATTEDFGTAEFGPQPVHQSLDQADVPEEQARLHGGHGRPADDVRRLAHVDARQPRRTLEQRVGRNLRCPGR